MMIEDKHHIIRDRTWRSEKLEEFDYMMIRINREDKRYQSRSHDDLWMSALNFLRKAGPRPAFQFFYILRATSTTYHIILKELAHYGLVKYVENTEKSEITKRAKTIIEITDKGNQYYEMMDELGKLINKPADLTNLKKNGLEALRLTERRSSKHDPHRNPRLSKQNRKHSGGLSYGKVAYNETRHHSGI